MHLGDLIDALVAHLGASLPAPLPALGSARPAAGSDLPCLVLAVNGSQQPGTGVGGKPRVLVRGALPVSIAIDLDQPLLRFPDDTVDLLSPDRFTLQLPHSPLVNADGSDLTPLGASDLVVKLGATTFTVVDAAPAPGEVRPDRNTGSMRFGAALPPGGSLQASYFIGEWEVETGRFTGELLLEVHAASPAAVGLLARQVAAALERTQARTVPGLLDLSASQWGPIAAQPAPGPGWAQTLAWRFVYEREEARILSGGGPIRLIHVTSATGAESFDQT